jgi:CobQ-like glutamine amidotransferase family enzyme
MLDALKLLGGLAILVVLVAGCEPTLSEQDLGNVVFEVPQVSEEPGTEPHEGHEHHGGHTHHDGHHHPIPADEAAETGHGQE